MLKYCNRKKWFRTGNWRIKRQGHTTKIIIELAQIVNNFSELFTTF